MVPLTSLWVPILLSAVLAFLASFAIHMLLRYHRNDFGQVPSEDAVMEALRKVGIAPGEYMIPRAGSPESPHAPCTFPEAAREMRTCQLRWKASNGQRSFRCW